MSATRQLQFSTSVRDARRDGSNYASYSSIFARVILESVGGLCD